MRNSFIKLLRPVLRIAIGKRHSFTVTPSPVSNDTRVAVQPRSQYDNAMTGNAGLNYAAWQLSRRTWHVMPTNRNARGSNLIVTNGDESIFFGVQSKASGKRNPIALGLSLDVRVLRSVHSLGRFGCAGMSIGGAARSRQAEQVRREVGGSV